MELLHHCSVLLLRDRVWVLAALNIVLPKVLLGRLVLMLLLVEYALKLWLFDGRLGHERLSISWLRPFLKEFSAIIMEVGVAWRCSRVIADIGLNSILFGRPVSLTVLGSLDIDLVFGWGRPPLLTPTLRNMTITTTHSVRRDLTVRWRSNLVLLAPLKVVWISVHDLLVLVGIAIDKYASAMVHAICIDTQVELNHVLYRLRRYGLICGNHLDSGTPTSVHLILNLLPAIHWDLGGEGRWFRVCVGHLFVPPDIVILLLDMICGTVGFPLLLAPRILEILKWPADLHGIMWDIVAVRDLAATDSILKSKSIAVILRALSQYMLVNIFCITIHINCGCFVRRWPTPLKLFLRVRHILSFSSVIEQK